MRFFVYYLLLRIPILNIQVAMALLFNGNPGSENCDRKLVEDKGWNIFVNPEDLINR